ncbi:MAG TPA: TonB-dependent receptor [Cyclobacteriaceae bacterium]
MTRLLLIATFISLSFSAWSQEKVTLNGYIKDSQTGEELIGVNVYIPQLKAGTVTNPYGFYSLTIEKGTYDLQFSYVGYQTHSINIDLTQNESRNIEMASEATYIKEVVVSDKAIDANVVDVQMSKNTLNMEQVRKLPALFGEVDIIKNIQMLPGVISAGEGTSSFYVRGGSADQNLILIDEAPIYDPSHLGGLISVFNADVIKDSELYKGGIPARFGGRLSSMLEVRTKDGNNKKFGASAGVGTLASRLMIEGPIRKEKSSFIVSARASNLGLYLKAANVKNGVSFYDLNGKANWRANNNNRFFVAFYSGRDKITFNGGDAGFGWGNTTGTFRWNHLFSERLFSNTSIIASQFDYSLKVNDPVQGFEWTSKIQEFSMKNDFTYFINTNNELTFGYHITGRTFQPGNIRPTSSRSIFTATQLDMMYGLDHALYLSNQQKLNGRVTLDYGLRFSVFQNVGRSNVFTYKDPQDNTTIERTDTLHYSAWKNIKVYPNVEPRLAIRYLLKDGQSVKLSYNRMVQNTHLISAGTVPLPFNTWSPSSYYLKPQIADQVAAGYFRNLKDNMFELSVETYYKSMQKVTDFADNAQIFFNRDISTEYRQGKSWSYGAEFMVTKKEGRLNGMISYTLSKTMRKIPGVNHGEAFPSNYDRRHVINMQAVYELSKRWTLGGNFIYNTGRPITLPAGKFEYSSYHPDVITERNGYRLPPVHRLDLSATFTPRKNDNRKWKSQWIFSVYNVYSRKNPFTIYTRTKRDSDGNVVGDGTIKEARMIYLFPVLPSVTYNVKF